MVLHAGKDYSHFQGPKIFDQRISQFFDGEEGLLIYRYDVTLRIWLNQRLNLNFWRQLYSFVPQLFKHGQLNIL